MLLTRLGRLAGLVEHFRRGGGLGGIVRTPQVKLVPLHALEAGVVGSPTTRLPGKVASVGDFIGVFLVKCHRGRVDQ